MSSRPTKPSPAPSDALADLRADFTGTDDAPERGPEPLDDPGPSERTAAAQGTPLASPDDRDAQRALVITAWHADTTTVGFLHGGGMCGCRYIANAALDAVLPVHLNAEPDGN